MINEKDKIIINPVEIFRGYLEVFNLTIEDFCYGVCNIVSPATKKMYDSHHEWWVKKIHKLLNGEINIDDHYDWILQDVLKISVECGYNCKESIVMISVISSNLKELI